MPVLLRKMLGIGTLPSSVRAELADEQLIHLAEFVPVTFRFAGHIPGKVAKSTLRSHVGALAFTDQRVLGVLSSGPKKGNKTIDRLWSAPAGSMVTGTIDEDGMLLDCPDISVISKQFSGSMSLRYKVSLPEEVLAQLPTRKMTFNVPQKYVYIACDIQRPHA
ncbi:MAG: hypothetical protein WCE30_25060 [Mycobacterium sp.]